MLKSEVIEEKKFNQRTSIAHLSAEDMLKSVVIEEKKFNQTSIRPVSLTWVLRICWIRTNLEIHAQEHSILNKLSPIQKHQEQIWPCHKNGQGQSRIIIWKKAPGHGHTTTW